jgi:RNA polymerase sigma-70 factor (ECF subfamily)
MHENERFDAVYREFAPAVIRYIRRRVERDDVEDLAAEVFVVAWGKLESVRLGQELPWLYRTAALLIANHRRRRRAVPFSSIVQNLSVSEETQTARRPDALDQLDNTSDPTGESVVSRRRALEVIDALSDEDRELLFLVAFEGCSSGELAVVLSCSEAAARKRLSRLRAVFANELA